MSLLYTPRVKEPLVFVLFRTLRRASLLSTASHKSSVIKQTTNLGAIQDSFANCNISVDLDLFNGGITEYSSYGNLREVIPRTRY